MIETLPKDQCRCYGEDCERKLDCLRYLTMKNDAVEVYRYALSLIEDDGSCEAFVANQQKF